MRHALLSTKLTLVVIGLVLAATLAMRTVMLMTAEKDMTAIIGSQQYELIAATAAHLDATLAARRATLAALAEEIPRATYGNVDALRALLDARQTLTGQFFNMALFTPDGKFLFSLRTEQRPGVNAATRPYFQSAVRTRASVVSPPFVSAISRLPIVAIAYPVLDQQGKVVYVLSGSISLTSSALLEQVRTARAGRTGFLYLMTADGLLVSHPDASRLAHHIGLAEPLSAVDRRALDGYEGWLESDDGQQKAAIYAFKRLAQTNWIVAARYPVAEAFAPMIAARERALFGASLLSVIAGLVGWTIAWSMLAPLRQLRRQVTAIKEGAANFDLLGSESSDEVGELSRELRTLGKARSEVEEKIRRNELFMRNMLARAQDAFIASDSRGLVIEWNSAAETMFQFSREEALGKAVAALIIPSDMRAAHDAGMRMFARSGTGPAINTRMRISALRKDLTVIPVELSLGAISTDDEHIATAFLRDLSERVRYEEQIASGEKHTRMIADNMPARIAYIDRDQRYRFSNANYRQQWALDQHAIDGMSVRECVGGDAYARIAGHIGAALGGEQRHVELASEAVDYVPNVGEDGTVHGVYMMALDKPAEVVPVFQPPSLMTSGRTDDQQRASLIAVLTNSLDQLAGQVDAAGAAIAEGKAPQAMALLHSLRGAWGSIGGKAFAQAAHELERALHAGEPAAALLVQLQQAALAMEHAVRAWLDRRTVAPAPARGAPDDMVRLMAERLAGRDPQACDDAEHDAQFWRGWLGTDYPAFGAAVARLEFAAALALLERYKT
jgi:PAS domain S-box-containing protein